MSGHHQQAQVHRRVSQYGYQKRNGLNRLEERQATISGVPPGAPEPTVLPTRPVAPPAPAPSPTRPTAVTPDVEAPTTRTTPAAPTTPTTPTTPITPPTPTPNTNANANTSTTRRPVPTPTDEDNIDDEPTSTGSRQPSTPSVTPTLLISTSTRINAPVTDSPILTSLPTVPSTSITTSLSTGTSRLASLTSSSSAASSTSTEPSSPPSNGVAGKVVGGLGGAFLAVAVVVVIIRFAMRRKNKREMEKAFKAIPDPPEKPSGSAVGARSMNNGRPRPPSILERKMAGTPAPPAPAFGPHSGYAGGSSLQQGAGYGAPPEPYGYRPNAGTGAGYDNYSVYSNSTGHGHGAGAGAGFGGQGGYNNGSGYDIYGNPIQRQMQHAPIPQFAPGAGAFYAQDHHFSQQMQMQQTPQSSVFSLSAYGQPPPSPALPPYPNHETHGYYQSSGKQLTVQNGAPTPASPAVPNPYSATGSPPHAQAVLTRTSSTGSSAPSPDALYVALDRTSPQHSADGSPTSRTPPAGLNTQRAQRYMNTTATIEHDDDDSSNGNDTASTVRDPFVSAPGSPVVITTHAATPDHLHSQQQHRALPANPDTPRVMSSAPVLPEIAIEVRDSKAVDSPLSFDYDDFPSSVREGELTPGPATAGLTGGLHGHGHGHGGQGQSGRFPATPSPLASSFVLGGPGGEKGRGSFESAGTAPSTPGAVGGGGAGYKPSPLAGQVANGQTPKRPETVYDADDAYGGI